MADCEADLTVAVINHNGEASLPETMAALSAQSLCAGEVLLVDDASTDGSVAYVTRAHGWARVVRRSRNAGKPGPVRNLALRTARTRYVMLLDHDVRLDPGALERLMGRMREQPRPFAVAPRLVRAEAPWRIYTDGTRVHYLGVSLSDGRDELAHHRPGVESEALAGGNVLLDREAALALGGYDEGYAFGWGEDAELLVRATLTGRTCVHVPRAVGRHEARAGGERRAAAQFHNRHRLVLSCYGWRTLLLLGPMLGGFELLLGIYAAVRGFGSDYARSWRWTVSSMGSIVRARRAIQRGRRRSDAAWLGAGRLGGMAVGVLVERVLSGYWFVVRRWLSDGRSAVRA